MEKWNMNYFVEFLSQYNPTPSLCYTMEKTLHPLEAEFMVKKENSASKIISPNIILCFFKKEYES